MTNKYQTATQKTAAYLRERKQNSLRDDIVRVRTVCNKTDVHPNHAARVLKAMYEGQIDGIELSAFGEAGTNGGRQYKIERVDQIPEVAIIINEYTCQQIRDYLAGTDRRLEDAGEEFGFGVTSIGYHARGDCKHAGAGLRLPQHATSASKQWEVA